MDDSGASHFAETVREIKARAPNILVECLTGDFKGKLDCVALVANSGLDVYAHNMETVEDVRTPLLIVPLMCPVSKNLLSPLSLF